MREKVVNSADYIIKILSVLVSVYFVSSLVYRNIYMCFIGPVNVSNVSYCNCGLCNVCI